MPQQQGVGAVILGSDFKALGVVRSLGRQGIPSIVIDNLPRSAWFSRYVVRCIKWHETMDSNAFVQFLLRIGKEYHLERWVLFPMQDENVALVARHTQQLTQMYQLVTQGWEVIRWSADKRLTYQMAQELGVPYPATYYPASEDDLAQLPFPYPVLIKPAVSVQLQYTMRLKALPAHNEIELRSQYRLASSIMAADEIMVQELVPGGGQTQYSVGTYCVDGHMLASMTAKRIRQYPIDYGLSSSFVEAVAVPVIPELAEKLLRFMGVTGMVEVEFKYDTRDQRYKLLDINVRPWGWHTLCMACGLDFPFMQYCDVVGQEVPPAEPNYGPHWIRLLTDLPAGLQEIRAGYSSPWTYIQSLKGHTVFSVFDIRDPLPLPGDFAVAISRLLRRPHKHLHK